MAETGSGKQGRRVWKPLDVNGLRLYRVHLFFPGKSHWNEDKIVAAHSPSHAADIVRAQHADTFWLVEPVITGHALDVCQPAEWRQ